MGRSQRDEIFLGNLKSSSNGSEINRCQFENDRYRLLIDISIQCFQVENPWTVDNWDVQFSVIRFFNSIFHAYQFMW